MAARPEGPGRLCPRGLGNFAPHPNSDLRQSLDLRPSYNGSVDEQELTGLQRTILEVEALDLPLREAMRLVNARVGFFVGQQRYKDELAQALRIVGADQPEPAETAG
ncbi:MAG: hypothetical protein ACKVVP_14285 [Chloroflexota bacterium]